MTSATAKRIYEYLPGDFESIIEQFDEPDQRDAILTLGELVKAGNVEQYRTRFIPNPNRLGVDTVPLPAPEFEPVAEPEVESVSPSEDDGGLVDAPDFFIRNEGSIFLVTPNTPPAGEHLTENVGDEAQWMGASLVVEHRYIQDLIARLQAEGFTVEEA